MLRAFLRALFAGQRRRAKQVHGVRKGQCAAVTFIQRFGSALNLTPHFHSLVLDGVYAGPAHSPGPFLPLRLRRRGTWRASWPALRGA